MTNGQLGYMENGNFVPMEPRQPTPEELEAEEKVHRKTIHNQVWMSYSLIAMQVYKMQAEQFVTPEIVAEKAAKLADCMLQQFVLRE